MCDKICGVNINLFECEMKCLSNIKKRIIIYNAFVFRIDTRLVSPSTTFTLPFVSNGNYECKVYWDLNDLTQFSEFSGYPSDVNDLTHEYPSQGKYTIKIVGVCEGWNFNSGGDNYKLTNIIEWGPQFKFAGNPTTDTGSYFAGCLNMNISAFDKPNLNGTTNLLNCFAQCSNLNSSNLSSWDVSQVTNMEYMFGQATLFNQSLNRWDTSNVTNMSGMFSEAENFNGEIANWNTSKVINMSYMFEYCYTFNKPIGYWDTSKVTNMSAMFFECQAFNQNINTNGNKWDVSIVEGMSNMFYTCINFNQPLNNWNVVNVNNMTGMFSGATNFNQNIGNWNTSNVINMSEMFSSIDTLNYNKFNNGQLSIDVSGTNPLLWNTSNVINMSKMFQYCINFNQDISYNITNQYWNTSNVNFMDRMFEGIDGTTGKHKFNNGQLPLGTTAPMGWITSILPSGPDTTDFRKDCVLTDLNKPSFVPP